MKYEEVKNALESLPLYAADWQDKEMCLVPEELIKMGCIEAAVSIYYAQKRSLLLLTKRRILVLNAQSIPPVVLDLPLKDIIDVDADAFYGVGNITCYTDDKTLFFPMMSVMVYDPLGRRIEELAMIQRIQEDI